MDQLIADGLEHSDAEADHADNCDVKVAITYNYDSHLQ